MKESAIGRRQFIQGSAAGIALATSAKAKAEGLVPVEQGVLPPPPSNSGIASERFCFYVGISRAERICIVTCPLAWRGKEVEPSRFIFEAGLILETP